MFFIKYISQISSCMCLLASDSFVFLLAFFIINIVWIASKECTVESVQAVPPCPTKNCLPYFMHFQSLAPRQQSLLTNNDSTHQNCDKMES